MTGISAIYSKLAKTRQPILSLTSTVFCANSQIHVRRSSILTGDRHNTPIVKPALKTFRTSPAQSHIFIAKQFTSLLLTVSILNLFK